MALPLYIGTIPDGSALQVLNWINNGFMAAFTQSSSPTPPENPVGWMRWGNSATGIDYIRDPQNVAWVPLGKFDAQSYVPFVATGSTGGEESGDSSSLGPYATLAAGTGFAAGANGVASVRSIVASDLPTLTSTSAGIAPTPTSANAGQVLRPTGWSPLFQNLGVKSFTGATSYVWTGFSPCSAYRFIYDVTLSGWQNLVLQIGSNGAPKTSGYVGNTNNNRDSHHERAEGAVLWMQRDSIQRYFGFLEISEMSTNTYLISGRTQHVPADRTDNYSALVTLTGPMNYLRVITSGPDFSFNSLNTISSGQAKLLGM